MPSLEPYEQKLRMTLNFEFANTICFALSLLWSYSSSSRLRIISMACQKNQKLDFGIRILKVLLLLVLIVTNWVQALLDAKLA